MSPFWSDFYPTRKIKDFFRGDPSIPCAPHASVLTALRHSGRSFTAHVAESAGVPKGFHPLTPRGALCPSTLYFYIISRRVLRLCPQHSAHFNNKKVRGCGGIIPPQGARGIKSLARGCGSVTPPRGYGAQPHYYFRAFSDMCGERAPAMTKCGEHEE